MIDLDALATAVADGDGVGENTEYSELAALERLAAGKPGAPDPDTQEIVGGEEPDWRKVGKVAADLLSRTKDLRVGCILVRAELATEGLAGLGLGLQLLARLLVDFWEGIYPQLDRDESDDPIERLSALTYLNDLSRFVAGLRNTSIVESREVGRYTPRDLDYATGRMPVPEGTNAPSLDLLAAAWLTGDPDANLRRRTGVDDALKAIAEIETIFRERTGERPDIDALKQNLRRLKDFFDAQTAAVEVDGADGAHADGADTGGMDEAKVPGTGGTAAPRTGGLSSRADAVRILKQVSDYLRRAEPSSPAPMFIDRAVKLLQMDFAAIVKELVPDARERIELLGGVPLDPPSE